MLKIDFLRHGEPEGGERYRGQTDDALSAQGWEQMRRAVGENHHWDRIISSPLRRCREFAETLAQETGIPMQIENQLKEIGFGRWEGLSRAHVREHYAEEWTRFYRDPVRHPPLGAEPLLEFKSRVQKSIENIVAQFQNDSILLVSHAGVIRMALQQVLGFSLERVFRLRIPYACLSRISYNGTEYFTPMLEFHAGVLSDF